MEFLKLYRHLFQVLWIYDNSLLQPFFCVGVGLKEKEKEKENTSTWNKDLTGLWSDEFNSARS